MEPKSFTIIKLKQMSSGKSINQKLTQVPVFSIHVYQCENPTGGYLHQKTITTSVGGKKSVIFLFDRTIKELCNVSICGQCSVLLGSLNPQPQLAFPKLTAHSLPTLRQSDKWFSLN